MRAPRTLAIVGAVIAAVAFVVIVGTLFQSRWTGDFGPCSRPLDSDGSTLQQGSASVAWVPPRIHCTFASEPQSRLAADSNDRAAYFGMAIVGMIVTAGALLFGLIWWAKADVRPEIPA